MLRGMEFVLAWQTIPRQLLINLVMVFGIILTFPAFTLGQDMNPPNISSTNVVVEKVKNHKEPFAIKHPKLHTFGRKLRKKVQATASTLAPYFAILSGVFQTLTYFKI